MSSLDRKQQTNLMKSIGKHPRHSTEQDLILLGQLMNLKLQLLDVVYYSASGRKALAEYARDCVSNQISKADFIVNLNSTKESIEEATDESKKSIQIIEELIEIIAATDENNFLISLEAIRKHRFTIKAFHHIAESIRVLDVSASKELMVLVKEFYRIREKLVIPHGRLVYSLAKPFTVKTYSHTLEDLTIAGFEGLLRAAERFDPELGLHFGTYASSWVKQVIARTIMDTGSIIRHPVHLAENINDVLSKTYRLENQTGLPPTVEQIAEATRLSVDKVKKAQAAMSHFVGIDSKIGVDSNMTFAETIADEEADSTDKQAHDNELRELLNTIIRDTLDERGEQVLRLRFGLSIDGEEHSDTEIGRVIGLSRERARQIAVESEELLKARTKTKKLQELVSTLKPRKKN